jgi:hypothetical protein
MVESEIVAGGELGEEMLTAPLVGSREAEQSVREQVKEQPFGSQLLKGLALPHLTALEAPPKMLTSID